MTLDKEEITRSLTELLNDCLESINQENSFKVVSTDLDRMKFTVEFDIVTVPEDGFIGFAGY